MQKFEYITTVENIETIARGSGIRDLARLRGDYGGRNWRKLKGVAYVELEDDGSVVYAEIHWYECHGIGKVEERIKDILED